MRGQLDRWLFRLGAPERGPIELVQRRIYVLPSRAGLVFAVVLVVMLLASINYGLSLGYGLVFLLSGAGIASILHAYRNLLGLRLRPGRCEPVFCGETASFRLVVENARATRRPALCLRLGKQRTAFELAPGETREVPVLAPTHRRGLTQPGRMVLEMSGHRPPRHGCRAGHALCRLSGPRGRTTTLAAGRRGGGPWASRQPSRRR